MPKKVIPITDTQIKNAKPQSKDYPIYDGNGLLLLSYNKHENNEIKHAN